MDTRIDSPTTDLPLVDGAAATGPWPIAPVHRALGANRIYGEPISAHGVTVVTAARIGGGAGGGSGHGPEAEGEGTGGGGGFTGRPVGAFVLREGDVRWLPAVDVNRLLLVIGAVAIAALLTARKLARVHARAERFLT